MMEIPLDTACRFLRGVGPARAATLAEAGIHTVEDLLLYLPLRYEDRARFSGIADLRPAEPRTVRATVEGCRLIRTRRRGFTILEVILSDPTGSIRALWYNQPYLRNLLREGKVGAFYGTPRAGRGRRAGLILENPRFELLSEDDPERIHTGRVVPIYRRIDTIRTRQLRQILHAVVAGLPERIADPLPAPVRRRAGLLDRREAFRRVHFPPAVELGPYQRGTSAAHRRLLFEEVFLLQAGLALQKRERQALPRRRRYRTDPALRRRLQAVLPYRLTAAQRRVLREIVADFRAPFPMHRLLQGEVGSGKTILALLAMLIVIENGYQAALMVPTGILAEQHLLTVRRYLRDTGIRVELLTSGRKGEERRRIRADLAAGRIPLVIGTHSLIQEGVKFDRLGLVVIDEQHRFGVLQRERIRGGGDRPDVLVMTATPIPRTMTLTVYGDLDLSILDELPPGRRPVRTFLRDDAGRAAVHDFVRSEAARGRQAFIVSPRLEETGRSTMRAARTLVDQLAGGPFRGLAVALLHGKMKPEEKEKVMTDFAAGRITVLVATTVVEVGIDIPAAAVMVIENAERFGLSQLHQLRGRVGRGRHGGVCVLLAGPEAGEEARRRLQVLVESDDGFAIAEADLEMRGPGELLGERQSGVPDPWWLRVLRNRDLLEEARAAAFAALPAEGKESSEARQLRLAVEERWPRRFGRIRTG